MKPKYSTWIRLKRVILFVLIFLTTIISFFWTQNNLARFFLLFLIFIFGYISYILLVSYYCFSDKGLNYQNLIHQKIVSKIKDNEKSLILDIGAGSGSLSIKTAKKNKNYQIKAIDYWGKDWNYTKNQTIQNAKIERVNNQIEFIKASASKLPFNNNHFDYIISCLTFHEVKDTKNKALVIKEALRTLKPGGEFILFDLFYNKHIFGNFNEFISQIKKEADIKAIIDIKDLFPKCPRIILHKKVLGYGVMLIGKKK